MTGSTSLPVAEASRARAELMRLLRRRPFALTVSILLLVGSAIAGTVAPALLGSIVDAVSDRNSDRLPILVAGLAAAALASGLLDGAVRMWVARLGEQVVGDLRIDVVSHVLRLPLHRIESAGRGELAARASGDVRVVGEAVSTVVPQAISAAFLVAATAAGIALIDPRLLAATFLAVPLQLIAVRSYVRRTGPLYRDAQAAAGVRSQRLLEAVDGDTTITAMGWSARFERRFADVSTRAVDLELRATRLGANFWNRVNLAEYLALAGVLLAGFFLVGQDAVSIGAVTAAALYVQRLFDPIGMVLVSVDDIQRAAASLARIVGILDLPAGTRAEQPGPRRHDVRFEDVEVRYGNKVALSGVDLSIADGETLAIVGRSGAGKSTLGAVLCGLLPPSSGRVVVGGVDSSGLAPGPGPRGAALVAQETHVFTGTLADNLRIAAPDATDERLVGALAQAGATEWFGSLPEALGTVVGVGGHPLGALETQQLALARVVLRDPRILVLDEATAAAAVPRRLDAPIAALCRDRTAVVIAHRLGQAQDADRVVVLDQGRIVEIGTHDDLVAAAGPYADLWHAHRP